MHSVVGFGGTLPNGELIAMIFFSRVPVGIDVADRFKPLALELNESLARFATGQTFDA